MTKSVGTTAAGDPMFPVTGPQTCTFYEVDPCYATGEWHCTKAAVVTVTYDISNLGPDHFCREHAVQVSR